MALHDWRCTICSQVKNQRDKPAGHVLIAGVAKYPVCRKCLGRLKKSSSAVQSVKRGHQ